MQSEKRARRDSPGLLARPREVVRVVKNLLPLQEASEARLASPGWEEPSIPLEHPTDRGAWWATCCKDLDMTEATLHIEKDELKDTEKEQTEKEN